MEHARRIAADNAGRLAEAIPVPPPPVAPSDGAEGAIAEEAALVEQAVAVRHGLFTPLRHRDFTLFWSGAFVSNIGTWLQNVALSWLVLQITNSPFWVSMVTFTQFFPMLLFGLAGGLAADRLERRRVLIVTQTAMMISAFALWAVTAGHHATVATVLPLLGIAGVAMSFNAPSFQALISDLVPPEAMLDAIAINTAQFSAARVVGPVLGGIALATIGAAWAFFANGLSFLAVIGALALIRPAPHSRPASTGRRALLGGVRAMNEDPAIKAILAITAVVSLFAAPVVALLPVVAKSVLHLGPAGFGGLFAVFSVGAVLGAVATGRLVRRVGMFWQVALCLVAMAAASLGVALSTNVVLTAASLVVIGFAYTSTTSTTNTGIQLSVAPGKRGRVMSLYMMAWAGLYPVGSVLAGIAATHVGAPWTLGAGAAPLAIAAVVVVLRGDVLRTINGLTRDHRDKAHVR